MRSLREEIAIIILFARNNRSKVSEEYTDEILKVFEKRANMVKNYEDNYDDQERYVIEHFLKELLK